MPDAGSALRKMVRVRADNRCEYCLFPEESALVPFEVDHILAIKHGGKAVPENLAWCCALCNRHKGSDIASIDL